jgi:flagellar basal-body rod protein FlgB
VTVRHRWHGACFIVTESHFPGGDPWMFDLDAHIGLHADALRLRGKRAELISRNLANADTPGFQARDFDFRRTLETVRGEAGGGVALSTTRSGHLSAGGQGAGSAVTPDLQYRIPVAPSADGNTVDVQLEQAAFAENAVKYQATLNFVNSKLRGLMTALTGQ